MSILILSSVLAVGKDLLDGATAEDDISRIDFSRVSLIILFLTIVLCPGSTYKNQLLIFRFPSLDGRGLKGRVITPTQTLPDTTELVAGRQRGRAFRAVEQAAGTAVNFSLITQAKVVLISQIHWMLPEYEMWL
jgi:hypothetical protein